MFCMQVLCAVVHSVGRKTVIGEKKYLLLFPDYFIRTSLSLSLSLLHVGKDLGRKEEVPRSDIRLKTSEKVSQFKTRNMGSNIL